MTSSEANLSRQKLPVIKRSYPQLYSCNLIQQRRTSAKPWLHNCQPSRECTTREESSVSQYPDPASPEAFTTGAEVVTKTPKVQTRDLDFSCDSYADDYEDAGRTEETSFEDILNSRIFKFTVGQNIDGKSTTFTVHEEAIAALSHPLQSLVRSGLSESETGHATWEHVSKETFVRFAQFAYTGEYSVPKLVIRVAKAMEDEKSIGEEEIAEQDAEIALDDDFNHWGFSAAPVERKIKGREKDSALQLKTPRNPIYHS
ncbi:hypothetical protein WAI453_000062 [Rhynchosporium graminicola]